MEHSTCIQGKQQLIGMAFFNHQDTNVLSKGLLIKARFAVHTEVLGSVKLEFMYVSVKSDCLHCNYFRDLGGRNNASHIR